jgi:pSer/pThr/pTyr-binding forkhead associated (FHA) protein
VLSRRTRIGRAAGCELQIESGSVSRHHALVVVGPREAVIEDLNSTNGVLVNGRKVSRQPLNDGDAVTIGEIQFRYFARPVQTASEPAPGEPAPGTST